MKLTVDRTLCISYAMCTGVAPDVFRMTDEGSLELLVQEVPEGDRDRIEEALLLCPAQALELRED